MELSRRTFLGTAGAAGLAILGRPLRAAENTPLRVALSGCSTQGLGRLRTALAHGGCTPVALYDAGAQRLSAVASDVSRTSGATVKPYTDFHAMLAVQRPEIVIVSSPRDGRPAQAIAALEAGAHVYIEAPVSPSIAQGRAIVRAARAAGRVVQVGLEQRTTLQNLQARAFIQSGQAGKIGMVRVSGNTPDAAHPSVHTMDLILWLTGETAPRRIFSTGRRTFARNGADTAGTDVVCFEFESFTAVWEPSSQNGCVCYGTEGMLRQDSLGGWAFHPSDRSRGVLRVAPPHAPHDGGTGLWADFLRCIRHGGTPLAGMEAGHRATSLSLLGMLSLQVGGAIQWNAARECYAEGTTPAPG